MASQVVGSQKFMDLEVVSSLKLDEEIVFETLTMDGENLNIVLSGVFSLVSLAADAGTDLVGVRITAVEEVNISSTTKNTSVLAGIDDVVDTDGIVVLGHQTILGVVVPNVSSGFVGGVQTLGFYGTAPIAKQVGVPVQIADVHAALVALGLIAGP